MNAISLFSGIGGIDLAAVTAGFTIIAQVEWDGFCQDVLSKHAPQWWPYSALFSDVRDFGRASIDAPIDLICGGFPCQPFSTNGIRLAEDDPRNMWPATRRIISEFRPRAVLLENVSGLAQRLKDEVGETRPGYLGVVLSELSEIGYRVGWRSVRASDIGAPHQRERIFIVAYAASGASTRRKYKAVDERNGCDPQGKQHRYNIRRKPTNHNSDVEHTASTRHIQQFSKRSKPRHAGDSSTSGAHLGEQDKPTAHQPGLVGNAHGLPFRLDRHEFPAGQGTFQHPHEPSRTLPRGWRDKKQADRCKALGNAVVPQVVLPITRAIYAHLSDT